MSNSDWHQTKSVHMAIQTVELNLIGFDLLQELSLSCSLMNIARGHCVVKIVPINSDKKNAGTLEILIDRPVMKADIFMKRQSFEDLCKVLTGEPRRPVTIITLLEAPLSVNLAGDLLIQSAAKLKIDNLSWIIPLQ